MLEWRNEVTSDLSQQPNLQLPSGVTKPGSAAPDSQQGTEVMILIWPAGDFVRLPRGTTAGQIVHDQVGVFCEHVATDIAFMPLQNMGVYSPGEHASVLRQADYSTHVMSTLLHDAYCAQALSFVQPITIYAWPKVVWCVLPDGLRLNTVKYRFTSYT